MLFWYAAFNLLSVLTDLYLNIWRNIVVVVETVVFMLHRASAMRVSIP